MKSTNENSLLTGARWAWNAFVVSNMIAALTMPDPVVPDEDVEEIEEWNTMALAALTQALQARAAYTGNNDGEIERHIIAIEQAARDFHYPNREAKKLLAKVDQLVQQTYAGIKAREKAEQEAYEAEKKRKWKAYRKANGYSNPHKFEGGLGTFMSLMFCFVTAGLWSEAFKDPQAPEGVYIALIAMSIIGVAWFTAKFSKLMKLPIKGEDRQY